MTSLIVAVDPLIKWTFCQKFPSELLFHFGTDTSWLYYDHICNFDVIPRVHNFFSLTFSMRYKTIQQSVSEDPAIQGLKKERKKEQSEWN